MIRNACTLMALLLLLFSGASAVRVCACLDAMKDAASCCEKKMPCCDGGECSAHQGQNLRADLAIELLKATDSVQSLPYLRLLVVPLPVLAPTVTHVPQVTRVRGPDIDCRSQRAPPYSR
ncbi:MAG: hypothetical protein ABIV13_04860 [Fimbriimonadales bacterium]